MRLISDLAALPDPASGSRGAILCPHFAGLDPTLADLAAVMPTHGINEALIEHCGAAERKPLAAPATSRGPVFAGILAVDPFVTGPNLFRALKRRGVDGVVNLPTVAFAEDEFRRALEAGGIGHDQELALLGQAGSHGLEAIATVFSVDQALAAHKAGLSRILLHPGLIATDPLAGEALAEGVAAVIERVRREDPDLTIGVYRHPALADRLDPACELADYQVDWAVADNQASRP